MGDVRPFFLVRTADHWRRAHHRGTEYDADAGVVQLTWEAEPDAPATPVPGPAGMAFDLHCRLYRALPDAGQVERLLWARGREGALRPRETEHVFAAPAHEAGARRGQFRAAHTDAPGPLCTPVGVAVDDGDRLFVSDAATGLLWIYDLWERRLLRKVFAGATGPIDLITDGRQVQGVGPGLDGLLVLDARATPRILPFAAPLPGPAYRIARSPRGTRYVLTGAGTAHAMVVPLLRPEDAFSVPHASGLAFAGDAMDRDELVVARAPGQHLYRYVIRDDATAALPPLAARGYDGRGIVRTPDGRIGFFTARGFRQAVVVRMRHPRRGMVTTFRLDAGEFQNRWGRVLIDACIPRGADVRVHAVVTDELPEGDAAEHGPLPEESEVTGRLYRRPADTGPARATYEAPVIGGLGRYLWLTLELSGDTRATPKVQSVRVERQGHELLRLLPQVFSRAPDSADFLRRYLAMSDSLLSELGARSAARHALVDPRSAPADFLPWLASFLGLVLDERWPVATQRAVIQEAMWLFRFRGTVAGLRRFLALFVGRPPVLIESFRRRGLGGAIVGEAGPAWARAVVGAGFRVGGAVRAGPADDPAPARDAFAVHAHRFTVVLPAILDRGQKRVVERILDLHRPCHTEHELCVSDGIRVGVALYAGLTSVFGRGAALQQARLGATALGQDGVLGRPRHGAAVARMHVGLDRIT